MHSNKEPSCCCPTLREDFMAKSLSFIRMNEPYKFEAAVNRRLLLSSHGLSYWGAMDYMGKRGVNAKKETSNTGAKKRQDHT